MKKDRSEKRGKNFELVCELACKVVILRTALQQMVTKQRLGVNLKVAKSMGLESEYLAHGASYVKRVIVERAEQALRKTL